MKLIRIFSVILPVLIFISGCQENNSTDEKLYKAVTSANAGDWDTAAAIADDVSAIYRREPSAHLGSSAKRIFPQERSPFNGEAQKACSMISSGYNSLPISVSNFRKFSQ